MCATLTAVALFRIFDKLWPPVETLKDAIGLISIEFGPLLTVADWPCKQQLAHSLHTSSRVSQGLWRAWQTHTANSPHLHPGGSVPAYIPFNTIHQCYDRGEPWMQYSRAKHANPSFKSLEPGLIQYPIFLTPTACKTSILWQITLQIQHHRCEQLEHQRQLNLLKDSAVLFGVQHRLHTSQSIHADAHGNFSLTNLCFELVLGNKTPLIRFID